MRNVRVHMYYGTTVLPKRELNDGETAHDILEIEIGDNEEVKELEMHEQKGVYIRRMETEDEAVARSALVESGRSFVAELGGEFTGNTTPVPKQITERRRDMTSYRYRLVTVEVVDALVEPAGEIADAEIVDESTWGDEEAEMPHGEQRIDMNTDEIWLKNDVLSTEMLATVSWPDGSNQKIIPIEVWNSYTSFDTKE